MNRKIIIQFEQLRGSFRRAPPPKQKKIYNYVTKEKDQMIFSHMISFCYTGG